MAIRFDPDQNVGRIKTHRVWDIIHAVEANYRGILPARKQNPHYSSTSTVHLDQIQWALISALGEINPIKFSRNGSFLKPWMTHNILPTSIRLTDYAYKYIINYIISETIFFPDLNDDIRPDYYFSENDYSDDYLSDYSFSEGDDEISYDPDEDFSDAGFSSDDFSDDDFSDVDLSDSNDKKPSDDSDSSNGDDNKPSDDFDSSNGDDNKPSDDSDFSDGDN